MFNIIENYLGSKSGLKYNKTVTVPLLIALSITFLFAPLYVVLGQTDVTINGIFPAAVARVGDEITISGSIQTASGAYRVWFGNKIVASGTAVGTVAVANFTLPELPGGTYTIMLEDVSKNLNATQEYFVAAGYYIYAIVPPSPAQLQEGSNVVLNVTVTGAYPGTAYYANITVKIPDPLNTNYSRVIALTGSTQTGTLHTDVTYPDSILFQPSGSTTNFTGLYTAYFNLTNSLAEDQFFVGFTDANEYHRGQSVKIRAIAYQPDDNSTITITNTQTGTIVHSEAVNASSEGVINSTWVVPDDALIGTYNITIAPQNTSKSIIDSQLFTIPGYPIEIRTLNLAGEPVPSIYVEALDQASNTIYNGTSGDDGIASVNLEIGNHTIDAFWNGVKVGEINASIAGASAYDLTCELTNLRITVQDKNSFVIPFVNLDITYQYVTTKGNESKTGNVTGQTDLSGTFSLNSTLSGISYTIDASIYGVIFNADNNTVSNLPAQPIFQVTILCPSRTLALKIIDYNLASIPNARTVLVEQSSGIFWSAVTGDDGKVSLEVTLGRYRLRIYSGDILLNDTTIDIFTDIQSDIRCILYNLQVSVVVIDYFGQPIPNINVILRGIERPTIPGTTKANGIAVFSNVIGGDMQIITYITGKEASYEAVNLQVEAPTAIQVKMDKYILLGPFLIETSLLATVLIILAAIMAFLTLELYRRRRSNRSKSAS
jgi:hypothetical protein